MEEIIIFALNMYLAGIGSGIIVGTVICIFYHALAIIREQ